MGRKEAGLVRAGMVGRGQYVPRPRPEALPHPEGPAPPGGPAPNALPRSHCTLRQRLSQKRSMW